MIRVRRLIAGIAVIMTSPAVAQGQQPPVDGTATGSAADTSPATPRTNGTAEADGQISDIVVTAQRRTENLQRVPISAQVFGQQTLAQQNLTSVVALAEQVPSIHVAAGGRSSSFYIRGTGSGESQSFDQSVGTFIDDIYHGRSRYSSATYLDLDHLEILKGPQSTFFGNSAIAGAFNIVTRKPGDKLEGWARALISPTSGENGGQYAVEGAVTLPLNDAFSLRVAATANGRRGYLRDVTTGERGPREDNDAVRATLRYAPGTDLDVTLKGEVGRSIAKPGLIGRLVNCPPPAPYAVAGFCALALADVEPTGLTDSSFVGNAGGQRRLHTYESVLTVNYQLGSGTLTSVTGYSGYKYGLDLDNDITGETLLNVQAPEKYHQFSQELRIASATDQPIEYLAGLYFQSDHLRLRQSVNFFFLTPVLSAVPPFAPLVPFAPLGQEINATQGEKIYSAFASVTWNVSSQLKLVGGLRGSIVTKDFGWNLAYGTATADYGGIVPFPASVAPVANLIGLGTAGTVSLDRTDKALMPSARLQYQLDRDTMAYVSYSRGFKAGGFSVADLTAVPSNFPFAPEHVNAYEIGLKSELFDRKVLVNLALFRNDFSDLQVVIAGNNAAGAFVNFVRNAAASRAQGAELEAQWVINPLFRLSAAGTYLDSKYRKYQNAGPTAAQQFALLNSQDLSGHPTQYAPKWSGNITGTLTVPVFGGYRLTGEATGILSTKYQIYSTDDPLTVQPGFARLEARVSLDSPGGRWGIDVIGKNLTNTLIRTFAAYAPASLGTLIEDREQLRNIALQVRYKF